MSMNIPVPPDDVRNALKSGLDPFLTDQNDPLRKILMGGQPIGGKCVAVPMFRVKLEDVAAGKWQSQLTGWRFLAVDGDQNGIVVDVTAPALGHPARVAGVQRRPQVGKLIRALRNVQVPPDGGTDDLELSFLTVPGLLTEAFWIKPKNNVGHGWAVPYRTLVPEFQVKRLYKLEECFDVAQSLAQDRLQQNDNL